ncbi:MAG: hypothetical protein Q4Q62_04525 [Thermoplasmata archaeon]|nr:hypothetical protein [Thermoplasmata archaeon]
MIIMARDRSYGELLEGLSGRAVAVWTCNTCARLCRGMGGREAAEALAARLSEDGADVRCTVSSSACCLMSKALSMAESVPGDATVLALCCDMGARNAAAATGLPVVNPVVTFGPGYLDADGNPRVASVVCGTTVVDEPLEEAAARSGCHAGPFRRPVARVSIGRRLRLYRGPC